MQPAAPAHPATHEPLAMPSLAREPLVIALLVGTVLFLLAGRYGYHRDELYFLAAGDHLAWGYPDQGPIVPALARLIDTIFPGSLVALRTPSALCAAGTVVVSALVSRELGGDRKAQIVAAACTAVAGLVLATGHLLSTTTLDLLAWTAATWLAVRAVRRGERRTWLVIGLVAGLALLVKPLVPLLLVALLAGVVITGPRRLLRSPWVWAGGVLALVVGSPYLLWQEANGWPQMEMAQAIAEGSSGSSEPRWLVLPLQLVLVSPLLVPVWAAGLVRLFQDPGIRDVRFVGWAYVVLAALVLVTGGKPYYLAQMYPVLLGVGAQPVAHWASTRIRAAALTAAVVLSAIIGGTITLPLLPEERVGPVLALNYDAGETIGWHALVADVSRAVDALPAADRSSAVILTANYGEAGALQRFGSDLPPVYSGHNGYGYWGPPPGDRGPVVVVGYVGSDVTGASLRGCTQTGAVDNGIDIDNDEQGAPILRCTAPAGSWSQVWRDVRFLG